MIVRRRQEEVFNRDERMFLESRKSHYDLVDKEEAQVGDYQNYNFIRIQ